MSIVIFDALGERLSAYVCELKTGPHSTAARFLQVNWKTEKSLISDYCERQFLVKYNISQEMVFLTQERSLENLRSGELCM